MSLILCFTMLLGTTFAWLSDSAVSKNNKVVAGILDIELWLYNKDTAKYVNISDNTAPIFGTEIVWEPGITKVAYLAIKNSGSLDLKFSIAMTVQSISKNLEKVLQYTIVAAPDGPYTEEDPPYDYLDWEKATKSDVENIVGCSPITGDVFLHKDETKYLALAIHMMDGIENSYQGGQINFDITVLAAQLGSEADSVDFKYDENATYPNVSASTRLPASTGDVTSGINLISNQNVQLSLSATTVGALAGAQNDITQIQLAHTTPVIDTVNRTVTFESIELLDQRGQVIDLENFGDNSNITITLPIASDGVRGINNGDVVLIYHDNECVASVQVPLNQNTITYTTSHLCEVRVVSLPTIENGVMTITTAQELAAFRDSVNHGVTYEGITIALANDIDLSGHAWTPIGTTGKEFKGSFNGNGHKILNLTPAAGLTSFGLFEKVAGTVVIENFQLHVNAVTTAANSEGWAGVVGMSNGKRCDLTLRDITVSGTVSAADKAAGLIAQAPTYSNNGSSLTVTNCVNEASVTGTRAAGICCSINTDNGNVFNKCINIGRITANEGKYQTAAGILCKNEADTVFTECVNSGILDATIAYNIATKLVITFTPNYRSGEARVQDKDTYYYTMSNPNIEQMYDLFKGEPYSSSTAVDWKQVVRTAHVADLVGLGAGEWYDIGNESYTVSATALNYKTPRYFTSLDEAFAHDLTNATVTLLADQTLSKTKYDQMTYTLDLNRKTLTANATIHQGINGGTVTLRNGTVINKTADHLFEITNQGKLVLNSVKVSSGENSTGNLAKIAASYTGTLTYDDTCSITGRIDLGENPATSVVINGKSISQESGRYVGISENQISS